MNLKKLARIKDTAQGGLLYGATKEQWVRSGAQDDGGVGFGDPSTGDYSFSEESVGRMGCSCFDDGGMALNHPSEVDQWAADHDMESKAEEFVTKKLDFLKGMSSDSKKDYYCYYGGVVVYCPDKDFYEGSQYEVLIPNSSTKGKKRTNDSVHKGPATLGECRKITKTFPFLELDDSDEYGFGLYDINNTEQCIEEVNVYLKKNYPGKFCFFHTEDLPEFNGIVGGLWVAVTPTSKGGAYYEKEALVK